MQIGSEKGIDELKIAIPIIGNENWMGGITYIHYLVNALSFIEKTRKPNIYLVFRDRQINALRLHEYMFDLFDGLIYVGENKLNIPYEYISCKSYDDLQEITDVYFPVNLDILSNRVSVTWIPDFQHKHLPQMFSKDEIELRDKRCEKISKGNGIVLFSSKDARNDYEKFYPSHNTINKVMPFYLVPPNDWYEENEGILSKYGIDDEYFICCNQLWKHKDHLTLFKAIHSLKKQGINVKVVLTGATKDYRFPKLYDYLTEYINNNDLTNNVKILGFIPRKHQIYLMRHSLAVIQPSLFEGWGTVLEDCRALGKTVILSNINIHYEQQTEYSIFFKVGNEGDLSIKIREVLLHKEKYDSTSREDLAKEKAIENAKKYALNFIDIMYEAYKYCQKED